MDYEKAYTNAVARAKQAIKDCGHNEGRKRMIEDIFPELADPDRIRQELIQYLKDYPNLPNGRYCRDDFFAWLEKQGEQKPTWSEEDDRMIRRIEQSLFCYKDKVCGCSLYDDVEAEIDWLKSLKDKPQPKQGDREWNTNEKEKITNLKTFIAKCKGFNKENTQKAFDMIDSLKPQPHWKPNVEQLTAFAVHLNKRGAFRDDLCMDFEHEAQSFIESQKKENKQ